MINPALMNAIPYKAKTGWRPPSPEELADSMTEIKELAPLLVETVAMIDAADYVCGRLRMTLVYGGFFCILTFKGDDSSELIEALGAENVTHLRGMCVNVGGAMGIAMRRYHESIKVGLSNVLRPTVSCYAYARVVSWGRR